MIGYGVGAEGSNLSNLGLGFVIAIAVHLIFGFFIASVLKIDSVIENNYRQRQFNAELVKPINISEKIISKILNQDINDADSFNKKVILSNTPKPESTISIQPSKEWIEAEIRTLLQENPDSLERFKRSFSEKVNSNAELTSFILVNDNQTVNVKTSFFGKDTCYLFDASEKSFGVVFFVKCKEKSRFELKIR